MKSTVYTTQIQFPYLSVHFSSWNWISFGMYVGKICLPLVLSVLYSPLYVCTIYCHHEESVKKMF